MPPLRNGSWIVTVPLAAATVAYVVWVFSPARKAIGQMRNDIAEKQQYAAGATSTLSALARGKQEIEKTRAYSMGFRKRLAREKDLSLVFAKIHALADAATVHTTRFEPLPAIDHETIRCVPVVVGCTGSFAHIHEFLRGIEEMPQRTRATSVRMERPDEFGKNIVAELRLEVFVDNSDNSDYTNRSG
jgi:Tfp pilus assembly protein PilO